MISKESEVDFSVCREINKNTLLFPLKWNGIWPRGQFSFCSETWIPFGTKLNGKLTSEPYSIKFERKNKVYNVCVYLRGTAFINKVYNVCVYLRGTAFINFVPSQMEWNMMASTVFFPFLFWGKFSSESFNSIWKGT